MTKPAAQRYKMPSGLGGVFIVTKIKDLPDGRALVRVDMRNPDWDGHQFTVKNETLTPI